MTRAASRELRNDTARLLRRVAAGELIEITVNGAPVAALSPLRTQRSHWTPRETFSDVIHRVQSDPGLTADLAELDGAIDELDPPG